MNRKGYKKRIIMIKNRIRIKVDNYKWIKVIEDKLYGLMIKEFILKTNKIKINWLLRVIKSKKCGNVKIIVIELKINWIKEKL